VIRFVYSVPPSSGWLNSKFSRLYRFLRRKAPYLPAPWRHGLSPLGGRVIPAPYSITQNLYAFLAARHPTQLYDLDERVPFDFSAEDIVIGHPWHHPGTIIQQALRNPSKCRLKALIFPVHHAMPDINAYAAPLVELADVVFAIMGPYWYDTLDMSTFASWKSKIVRLDMAVDAKDYPTVKHKFNPPGQRGYLYIGRNQPEKGCDVLSRTMAGLLEFKRGWVGFGKEIPNIQHLSGPAELKKDFMAELAQHYDFFVNTSISDANPTTILEAMAWGFPVACTPQSGYYNTPNLVTLSTTDIEHNIRALKALQYAPESELERISQANTALVLSYYTWSRFCETVWNSVSQYL
jgi:glycosyltransferase involved in cell wall biosynthesis